jgi:copper chaperone CopZ
MVRLIRLAFALAFVAGCNQQTGVSIDDLPKPAAALAFNTAVAPTVEFTLPDMMCEDGCAWTVKDILSKQPGAKDVRVDFEAKTATVAIDEGRFDSQLAIAELIDKGFTNSQVIGAEREGEGIAWTSYPPDTETNAKQSLTAEKKDKKAANEKNGD